MKTLASSVSWMNVYTLYLLLKNLRSSYFYCHCWFTSNYQIFSFKVCLVEDERSIACFNWNPFTVQLSPFQIVLRLATSKQGRSLPC